MKLRKRIRRVPEALLVLFARAVIPRLSRRGVLRLSRFLGYGAYLLSPTLRRVAAANLDLAFGDTKTAEEKRAINLASFRSFTLVMLDLFWFNRRTLERLDNYLKYDDSFALLFREPPAIILTAHIGNWEIVSVGAGAMGLPMTSIAMPMKNPFADQELNRLREKTGSETAARKGAIRYVIKALRGGRGTALLVDQNTLPEEGGIFVPFFGLPVPVTKATGSLWARTKAKIMVSWCIPDDNGVYTVYSRPPLSAESLASTEATALRVTQELEKVIREHPQFWLWSYKRWRFYREIDDSKAYPFYAESYEEYSTYRALVQKHRAAQAAAEDARLAVSNAERTAKRRARRSGRK